MTATLDSVMAALRSVKDPHLNKDYMSLGMIRDLKIEGDTVSLTVSLPSQAAVARAAQIEHEVKDALLRVAGATQVRLKMSEDVKRTAAPTAAKHALPGIRHVIAVSSGKGGVGKSTVAANLATALSKAGAKVGLLDTDVYGPNIPTMMGILGQVPYARQDEKKGEMILPLEAYGVKIMSMGLLTKGDQPVVWRGPMLHGVLNQFLNQVDWGELDYLIVDMPPGTGDVQLSLTQLVPVTGAVVVTTPQEVALQDVRKAILMFEKVGVPVLGIVENMSYFLCDSCDKRHNIFGTGGGKSLAEKYRTRLLAEIPLGTEVREAGDTGTPVVIHDAHSIQAQAFVSLASAVVEEVHTLTKRFGTETGAPNVNIGQF